LNPEPRAYDSYATLVTLMGSCYKIAGKFDTYAKSMTKSLLWF